LIAIIGYMPKGMIGLIKKHLRKKTGGDNA